MDRDLRSPTSSSGASPLAAGETTRSWQLGLPALVGLHVTVREVRASDASALFSMLVTDDVARFISPPPSTPEAFERFIAWTHRMRKVGTFVCFAVTTHDSDTPIGIFQLREIEPGFANAEWGFAIASEYWGAGVFADAAELVMTFAFETLGVHRLEARAAVKNGRGNGALKKIGAVQEGVLRQSFLRNGEYMDQVLWSILPEDRFRRRAGSAYTTLVH